MKKLKKIGIIIMVGLLSLSFNGLQVFAMDEKPYQEYHGQLDLNRLELSVNDQKELIVSVDESLNFFDRIKGEREKRETEELFQQYPDMKDGVVESIRYYEPIQAIGYTVAPIVCIDNNHYERIRRENMFLEALISPFTLQAQAANSAGGKTVTKDYFTLQTAIARTSYNSTTKEYRYVATTNAVWTKNSILGGSKYPDGGEDYVLQAIPTSMKIKFDSFLTDYTNSNKKEYSWPIKGDDSYIQYAVKDDPLGPDQLKKAILTTDDYGKSQTAMRRINSYYVHTWQEINIHVSANILSDSVSLSITPEKEDRSWTLYSYVTFNF